MPPRLHLDKIGAKLTPEQADYIGVKVEGPCKAEHYRYRSAPAFDLPQKANGFPFAFLFARKLGS